jgi:CubicO group peptidase (beta-lactamase class C family)
MAGRLTAALALVGEGMLELDEPVARLLPEYAHPRVLRQLDGPLDDTVEAERPITLRQLLTFTYGFGMCVEMFMAPAPWPVVMAAGGSRLATLGPPAPAEQPDPDTWIGELAALPLMAQPGERWLYNTSASVLGVLVARAAGAPLAEVLRTRIFEPLGMRDTAFFAADVERLATAYQPTPEGLVVWDPPEGQWSRPPAFADGAAGLVSTVDDLHAFARMLLAGGSGLLGAQLVAEMTSDQLTAAQRDGTGGFLAGRSWGWGQSVLTEGPHAGAYGWDGGLGTSWLVDPVRDLVVVVLTQRLFEQAQAPKVHGDLQEAAYAALA